LGSIFRPQRSKKDLLTEDEAKGVGISAKSWGKGKSGHRGIGGAGEVGPENVRKGGQVVRGGQSGARVQVLVGEEKYLLKEKKRAGRRRPRGKTRW